VRQVARLARNYSHAGTQQCQQCGKRELIRKPRAPWRRSRQRSERHGAATLPELMADLWTKESHLLCGEFAPLVRQAAVYSVGGQFAMCDQQYFSSKAFSCADELVEISRILATSFVQRE
jgi:hypothetical protein